jgi:uncharacterized protein YegJ (DUF2314 family)
MNAVQIAALVALLLLFAGIIYFARQAAAAAVPIDPANPLWIRALERARATVSQMRGLFDAGHEVWVKFPLQVGPEREHFWGRIRSAEGLTLCVAVETRPVRGGNAPEQVNVSIEDLEDWQVQLADGSIRGGFTTRAQAEMACQQGRPVPPHIAEMLKRMIDE